MLRPLALLALALPVAAQQTVWYVDADATGANTGTSWADAFPLLQDALAVATGDDQVWVAEGRYVPDQGGGETPGDEFAIFAVQQELGVYGGFDGTESALDDRAGLFATTILDGDLDLLEPSPLDLLGHPRYDPEVAAPDVGVPVAGGGVPDMGAVERYADVLLEFDLPTVPILGGGIQLLVLDPAAGGTPVLFSDAVRLVLTP